MPRLGSARNPASISTTGAHEDEDLEELENTPGEAANFLSFPASSRVEEAAYDKAHQRLYVGWKKPGQGYVYEGVPESVWRNFRRSASAGKFVNRVLNSYDYHPGNF